MRIQASAKGLAGIARIWDVLDAAAHLLGTQ